MCKCSTYTTLTLELCTSDSTVAIKHVCQLLSSRIQYVHGLRARIYYHKHVATIETMCEASKSEWSKAYAHALLPLQLGIAICYQYESTYFSR